MGITDTVKNIFNSNDEKVDIEEISENTDNLIRSSHPDIAEAAYDLLCEKYSREELPFTQARPVLLEAERRLGYKTQEIIDELNRIELIEEGSIAGVDLQTMLYIIEEDAGENNNFVVLGGGESLIYNFAELEDWGQYETELIIMANKIAGEENDLHKHLLLDTVVILPKDPDIIYEVE